MTYKNKKTGEVIFTSNKISGKNWEQVDDTKMESQETADENTVIGSSENITDGIAEDAAEVSHEEVTEENVEEISDVEPIEKPKRTRRGKK